MKRRAGPRGAANADDRLSVRVAAAERPERLALVGQDGRRWTWRELWAEVQPMLPRVPRQEQETVGSDRVSSRVHEIEAPSSPETVFRIFAAIEAAAPFAPIDPRLVPSERTARRRALQEDEPGSGPAPLAVLFTSGSTGGARGVELSRAAFLASAAASESRLGWRDSDRWLCVLPLAHVGGLSILTRCLIARMPVVLADRFDPEVVANLIERESVTLVSLVPTMLSRLLDLPRFRAMDSPLRAVLLGGAAGSERLWSRALDAGIPVLETWGMTETCSQIATARPGGDPRKPIPLDGWEVRDRGGRLEVRGKALLTRYVGAADSDPPRDGDGWFRTGDAGRVNEDGSVSIFGRADDLIVTGGENVSPAAVERFLENLPDVDRAVVVGVPDEEWGEIVAAALQPRPGVEPSSRSLEPRSILEDSLRQGLKASQRPRMILWLEKLPETASGKVDKAAVRQMLLSALTGRRSRP